jgi:hypothetical protein
MDPADDENSTGASAQAATKKPNYPGPKPGVKYPVEMIYCGG